MTLHILSQPPSHSAFKQCLAARAQGAPLVLIGDGVYCAATLDAKQLQNTYALLDDCKARGLTPNIETIDYPLFVELTCQHNPIQTWY